ncbi:MAG: ATP-binding protein [Lautropia sp.]
MRGDAQGSSGSLARRFSLGAAGLAAVALLAISLASWWLVNRQHRQAIEELSTQERQMQATAVGRQFRALADRMAEVAANTILATGIVDSAGRETYLAPFLAGIRQVNGVPVQVLFTDFEGQEISSNGIAQFTPEQQGWFRRELQSGQRSVAIFGSGLDAELVALEPLTYARTASPEGALLYKVRMDDVYHGDPLRLEWGADPATAIATAPEDEVGRVAPVPVPPVFEPMQFRIRSLGDAPEPAHLTPQYLTFLGLALALFSAVLIGGMQLARLLTHDLQQLETFARRLTGSGLSPVRAPVTGSDEVASLAASINEMLDRLNDQHNDLLGDREKLSELAAALQQADRRKDEFLAMLAHELRNPLAPILTAAQLLKARPDAQTLVTRTADIIGRQALHMSQIVDDLLDVSRVTRGLVSLQKTAVEIGTIVSAALDQARPLIEARRHHLAVRHCNGPVYVSADAVRMVQVLSNLLNNAAKFTPEGGHVSIDVEASEHTAVVAISDDGDGIPVELMPSIFELFTQGSQDSARAKGGLGLGLALVRSLVELHGGRVQARSAGAGRGARFTVSLPRIDPPVNRLEASVPQGRIGVTGATRIMIVDDNRDAAESLASLLSLDGYEVAVYYDGPTALRAANRSVELFLLDLGLPGMDGIELARRLRAAPSTQHAILVALTGYGQSEDRVRSAAAGFDHHLVKPIEYDTLKAVIAKSLESRPSADRD